MNTALSHQLERLALGPVQEASPFVVVPILEDEASKVEYLALTRAMELRLITVKEVSEAGTVPELMVTNDADLPVLLLDGEEISGARQNRILNTTILVPERSSLKIPVSCTEQGRWHYTSRTFQDSGLVAARSVRVGKHLSVSDALEADKEYRSDQGEVWSIISKLSERVGTHSATGAMRDVFSSKQQEVDAYMDAFPLLPRQRGLFVLVRGRVLGLDMVSRPDAYASLHSKLVKSYVIEPMTGASGSMAVSPAGAARAFVADVLAGEEKTYETPGYGLHHRLSGTGTLGTALLFRDEVIHLSCFSREGDRHERPGEIASYRHRQRFRRG